MNKIKPVTLTLISISIVSLLLSGCTSFNKSQVDGLISQWQGKSISDIILALGVPTRQTTVEEKRILEWALKDDDNSSSSISIGSGRGGSGWFGALGVTLPISSEPDTCILRAISDDTQKTIETLNWSGDSDVCGAFLTPQK